MFQVYFCIFQFPCLLYISGIFSANLVISGICIFFVHNFSFLWVVRNKCHLDLAFIIIYFNFLIICSGKIQFSFSVYFSCPENCLFLASVPLPSSVNTEAGKALGIWQRLHLLQIHCSCHVLLLQSLENGC